jgi:hypothetical protein
MLASSPPSRWSQSLVVYGHDIGTSRKIAGMKFVKITTEQVVAEDDAEAVTELMNVAVAGVAEQLTVYDSVVASVNTTEPENPAEVARP